MHSDDSHDNRFATRFEPDYVDATLSAQEGDGVRGRVLDISRRGLAMAVSINQDLPKTAERIDLALVAGDSDESPSSIGSATTMRTWSTSGKQGETKGIAVCFDEELSERKIEGFRLAGRKQKDRIPAQEQLAALDIAYLGDYRRSLADCQMQLFMLTLTVGVALAGAYFGLTYHNVWTEKMDNPDLAFWRTMIAALPGLLAIACAFMVAQKSISIQRIDAYLSVLKEWTKMKQFPREYNGWETDLRKFRHILRTEKCNSCKITEKCGEPKSDVLARIEARSIFRNPGIDLYQIVINLTFLSVIGLSVTAVVINVVEFKMGAGGYMIVASAVTLGLAITIYLLFRIFFRLRKGIYSVDYFRSCWINILNKCRRPI